MQGMKQDADNLRAMRNMLVRRRRTAVLDAIKDGDLGQGGINVEILHSRIEVLDRAIADEERLADLGEKA